MQRQSEEWELAFSLLQGKKTGFLENKTFSVILGSTAQAAEGLCHLKKNQ